MSHGTTGSYSSWTDRSVASDIDVESLSGDSIPEASGPKRIKSTIGRKGSLESSSFAQQMSPLNLGFGISPESEGSATGGPIHRSKSSNSVTQKSKFHSDYLPQADFQPKKSLFFKANRVPNDPSDDEEDDH